MFDRNIADAQIILIGNYPPDKQESMERFAQMLQHGFQEAGYNTVIWRPQVFFAGRSKSTLHGLGKWLGYIDKWIIFPLILRWRFWGSRYKKQKVRVHICDHSNSMYFKHLPLEYTGITCHDVLAIRGAMGFADAYCPASNFGKILQKLILNNLLKIQKLACVSEFTLNQLLELAPANISTQSKAGWRVIHNALNAKFNPIDKHQAKMLVQNAGFNPDKPFLLHVGSDLPRKNRKILLDLVKHLDAKWDGNICYVGQPVTDILLDYAEGLGLEKRVYSLVKPNHEVLVALYNLCETFIFPSFSEGFGWPVIEAQACGAPVIASNVAPMPEVGGSGALYANPDDFTDFAHQFIALSSPAERNRVVNAGYDNIKRFEFNKMIDTYLSMYSLERLNK